MTHIYDTRDGTHLNLFGVWVQSHPLFCLLKEREATYSYFPKTTASIIY